MCVRGDDGGCGERWGNESCATLQVMTCSFSTSMKASKTCSVRLSCEELVQGQSAL